MKKTIFTLIITILFCQSLFSQIVPPRDSDTLVHQATILYKSEMASWYGSDITQKDYPEVFTNIGGYISYTDDGTTKCIFYSKDESPTVLSTISFDESFNIKLAKVKNSNRKFTKLEKDLYTIRELASHEIENDTLFKFYQNTGFNVIPIIENGNKKVYVLTATTETGVVIFGNDYLLRFDKNNKLISKKALHNNIIYSEYDNEHESTIGAIHNHSSSTSPFITITDICTLMLYEKFTNWKQYMVVSKTHSSIWKVESNSLLILIGHKSFKERFEDAGKELENK